MNQENQGVPAAVSDSRPRIVTYVEVPLLISQEGEVESLPGCAALPSSPDGSLVEAPALTREAASGLAAAVAEDAALRGPGAHELGYEVEQHSGRALPVDARGLDAWALAEELLGIDLGAQRTSPALQDLPRAVGHAVEARILPDVAAATTVRYSRTPHGPGIRVVSAARVGDAADASTVMRIVAHGRDRATALARLHRALLDTAVVLTDGPTNRCRLIAQLEVELQGSATITPASTDPLPILVAAVRASDAQRAVEQGAFHARAARGRPEVLRTGGIRTTLLHLGQRYDVEVFRTAPTTYRISADGHVAELAIDRLSDHEWEVVCSGQRHRAVVAGHEDTCLVEVDGRAHSILLEEGVPVRAEWPALVVSVAAAPGDSVAEGDPLVVVEAMKMESTIRSPLAGRVTVVEVLPNEQVEAGTPLVRMRPEDTTFPTGGPQAARAAFAGMALADTSGQPPCVRVFTALRSYLLGYELDPKALSALLTEQRSFGGRPSASDPQLMAAEDEFLDLFTEIGLLWQTEREMTTQAGPVSSREFLLAYLQWLDPDRAALPDVVRRRLARALARYDVHDLHRSPALDQAVVLLFGSQARLAELSRVVVGILERRLRFRDRVRPFVDASSRTRYDRLTAATVGRLEQIADLSRDARFRFIDEPMLDAERAHVWQVMEQHLDALEADPDRPDREDLVRELVECPQPMREVLLDRWTFGVDPAMQQLLLEVRARRWYRIRELRDVRFSAHRGVTLCSADYDVEGRAIHLVMACAPTAEIPALGAAVAEHLLDVEPGRAPIVDVMTWRTTCEVNGDDLAAQLGTALAGWDLGRRLWRVDITVTSMCDDAERDQRTQYVTFREDEHGEIAEDRLYRNLHPMLAKRLELWRLGNFALRRLPSPEDVYLFHGVAHQNPKDHRLFALAEVRDLTGVPIGHGDLLSYPKLERMGLQTIVAMREARAAFSGRDKPQNNRITLFVRPPWDVPRAQWQDLAELLVPLATGAGLEMVVLRTVIPQPDGSLAQTVLNVEGLYGRSVTVTEEPARDDPVRVLTPYRQKVLVAQRFGVPYPFEILRMFAPRPGTLGKFRPARFQEYDLDERNDLVPVDRPAGLNTANVVVGLLTTYTDAYPEGMTRVAILSDPTKGLGNLAEPECRRVNTALDLAEQMGIPVEWFAVSSGALISMTSGTENMDWIAATLRRIIEFTQAGGEINIIVTGINVGGQPYWNAEATMLLHTRGILVMTPESAMVLTGKQALDFSGGVSADDNFGIGGFERVMGPNGQAQYWAPSLTDACQVLMRHYEYTYVAPGERFPRRVPTTDPLERDVRSFPHAPIPNCDFTVVGDVFSAERNPERKKPFDVRSVMRSVSDSDCEPLERWARWRGGENSVVWDARVGGIPVCMLGLESRPLPRRGFVPADGPPSWTSGTLFPQASRKTARAVNAASGNRPLVVLANLSGFDGSPESMRRLQLEFGAEIGRAVTNFRGPIVFVVISRYHGGAFVVFSKALNPAMEVAAVEGSFASVIGGAPSAATVFAREVRTRVEKDPRVLAARSLLTDATGAQLGERRARLAEITEQVRSEKLGQIAGEFDSVHTIDRALQMGSVDRIIPASELRPYVIDALERGLAREQG